MHRWSPERPPYEETRLSRWSAVKLANARQLADFTDPALGCPALCYLVEPNERN
jgi:hypothetical protein